MSVAIQYEYNELDFWTVFNRSLMLIDFCFFILFRLIFQNFICLYWTTYACFSSSLKLWFYFIRVLHYVACWYWIFSLAVGMVFSRFNMWFNLQKLQQMFYCFKCLNRLLQQNPRKSWEKLDSYMQGVVILAFWRHLRCMFIFVFSNIGSFESPVERCCHCHNPLTLTLEL